MIMDFIEAITVIIFATVVGASVGVATHSLFLAGATSFLFSYMLFPSPRDKNK